jgi:KDO2-lipid IV(A) lauroyltransferase
LLNAMRAVPQRLAGGAGEAVGRVMSLVAARKNSKARVNLLRAGVTDTAPACRRGWGCTGRTAFEMLWMFPRDPGRMLRETRVEGLPVLDAAVREGHGVLLVSVHAGNWELVPIAAGSLGVRVAVVARTLRAPRLERRIVEWRRLGGVTTLIRGAEGSSIAAYRTLARGGILGCMMDRASTGPRISTPFLGGTTFVPSGPLTLAQRTGAAIVLGTCARVAGRTVVTFRRVPCLASQPAERVAAAILGSVEEVLRDRPEEWLWIHRLQPSTGL